MTGVSWATKYVKRKKSYRGDFSKSPKNPKKCQKFDKTLEWSPGPPIASKFEVIFFYEYPTPKWYTIKKF